MGIRWPWQDPDPLPPVVGSHEAAMLLEEALRRKTRTLETVKRSRRIIVHNHFADDVRKALEIRP
jgi:hypothetical protein